VSNPRGGQELAPAQQQQPIAQGDSGMLMNHPTDPGRSKDVPNKLVERFLKGGWTKAKPAPKPDGGGDNKPPAS
jgi:hypothetical protein